MTNTPNQPAAPGALSDASWLRPVIHPVYARLLCAWLLRHGFTRGQALEGTLLQWDALHQGSEFLSLAQVQRLVARALALTGRPWLGLEVGLGTDLAAHGPLGYAGMACDNLAQVLELIQRFGGLRQALVSFDVEIGERTAKLVLHDPLPDPAVREYVLGHVSGSLLRLLQSITGSEVASLVVLHWPLPQPADHAHYDQTWGQVVYGAARCSIELPKALLLQPGLAPDPAAKLLAVRECEQRLLQRSHGTLSDRIKNRLMVSDKSLDLPTMAALEHVSARTLIRQLGREGSSYQALLDSVRTERACWLLTQGQLSTQAISERLGFADPSNFSRTFRRWTGMTPSGFAAQASPSRTPKPQAKKRAQGAGKR